MNIHFDRYENGNKWWDINEPGYNINANEYITEYNNVNEFINIIHKLFISLEEYNDLIDEITLAKQNKKILPLYKQIRKDVTKRFNSILKNMPFHIRDTYQENIKLFNDEINRRMKVNTLFIINNIDEIMTEINKIRLNFVDKIKQARVNANKKYYEKQKELIKSVPKIKKTAEELKQARINANKKYYETKKALIETIATPKKTAEDIKKERKEYNKKYYEENIKINNEEPEINNDGAEKRKEYNKKYYESKKELLSKIKILESQVQIS